MSEHVYQKFELTGSSKVSIEDAVQGAIAKVAQTQSKPRWFEVSEIRGMIDQDKVGYWQVTVRIGCDVS
jgi:hypothetical protein